MFSQFFCQLSGTGNTSSNDVAVATMPQPEIRSSKRKRNHVSYIEHELELEGEDDQAGTVELESGGDISDDDYSPTRRGRKTKSLMSKKAKLTNRSKTKRPDKPFPFMLLPAELREYIYDLALVDPTGLKIVARTKNHRRTVCRGDIMREGHDEALGFYSRPYYSRRYTARKAQAMGSDEDADAREDSPMSLVPNLLAVSKQIHSEAASMLYMQDIIFEDTLTLHRFLAVIGPSNMKLLTHLTVRSWGCGRGTHKAMNHCALTLLAGATKLKSLFLDCRIGWFRHQPVHLARQIYRDGHIFFEAYGAANGRKDAGIDILEVSEENFDRQYGYYAAWRNRTIDQVPEPATFKEAFHAELRRLLNSRPYVGAV